MNWIKIVASIIEFIMFCMLIDNVWKIPKNNGRKIAILNFLVIIIFSVIVDGIEWGILFGYIYHLAFFIIVLLRYKLNIGKKIILSITGVLLMNIFELCVMKIAELIAVLVKYNINTNRKNFIVCGILCIILLIISYKNRNKDLYIFDYKESVLRMFAEMFGCFVFYVCCIILSEIFLSYDSFAKPAVLIFGSFGYGGIIIGLILVYKLLVSRKMFRQSSEFNRQQLIMKEEYYKKILESQHETKKIRHDIKNNLNTLHQLLIENKYDDARRFLDELDQEFNEIQKIYSVGNEIVDLIINDKYSKAVENGIKCSTDGILPDLSRMSTLDLCTIFSNLFDNAIEGASKVKSDKFISLSIRTYNDEVMILLENSCVLNDFKQTDKLKTTKANSANHGYGTENVRSVIEKYSGRITYECQNSVFAAKIVMNKN